MSRFQQKVMRHIKKHGKKQHIFQRKKQPTVPDSDMTKMLGLSDIEFKIIPINMLKAQL